MTNYLLFTSTTCGPCKFAKPTIHRVAIEKDVSVDDVVFQEAEGDSMFEVYEVSMVPTLMAIGEDDKEIERLVGKFTASAIGEFMEKTK
ncbi:thioredoxin family protein [Streptomyces vinaceus]|uniref:thioredoxin family protein n=1 Tax=Streptomyces vinaceus TaxID=1960 RepID=UPI0036AF8F51